MYRVTVNKNRPDFRVFIDLLFGTNRNVDTDGDSYTVNSRTWTYLYIKDRESDAPRIEIAECPDEPGIFTVNSASEQLAELAALYLFHYSGSSISKLALALDAEAVQMLTAKYFAELGNARCSIWHRSSDECPYPNRM